MNDSDSQQLTLAYQEPVDNFSRYNLNVSECAHRICSATQITSNNFIHREVRVLKDTLLEKLEEVRCKRANYVCPYDNTYRL